MKIYRYIGIALVTVLLSLCFAACSNDDNKGGNSGIVGLWKSEKTHDGEGYFGYEFKSDGKGIYYDDWEHQGNVECFDYTYDASSGKLTLKWHEDTGEPNWDSPVTKTDTCTVTLLSNNRVRVVEPSGYTMFLVRQ